ncbi:UNVERIFIED_CONTAM: hypothetical protein ODX46_25395, partial [Salmonella enterica subsp. enterica serovar Enteritidis]
LGCEPIAVQSDHLNICKPENRKSPVFISMCGLIRSLLKDSAPSSTGGSGGNVQGEAAETTHAGLADESVPAQNMEGITADIARDFEYFTTVSEDDRRDLEQKLTDVGRAYAVRDAKRKKE